MKYFLLVATLVLSACGSGSFSGGTSSGQNDGASNDLILHARACNKLYGAQDIDGLFRFYSAHIPNIIMLSHGGGGSQLRGLADMPSLPPDGTSRMGITYHNSPGKFSIDIMGSGGYSWDYSGSDVIYRETFGSLVKMESKTSKDCKVSITKGYEEDGVTVAGNFEARVTNGVLNGFQNESHFNEEDSVTERKEYTFNFNLTTLSGTAVRKDLVDGVLWHHQNFTDTYSTPTHCMSETTSCVYNISGCAATYTQNYCL